MKKIRLFVSVLLALCILLTPLCAFAEAEAPQYDLTTVTITSITVNDPTSSFAGELPLDIKMSLGMNGTSFETMRALIALDLGMEGEHLLSLEGAIEDNEIKFHISGMSQDICIPMGQALELLLSETFLGGEPLREAPPEFFAAFNDLMLCVNRLLSGEGITVTEETPKYYLYSEDDWRTFFVDYPAKMRAVPAGEEEIVFEGKTYTARKYTYHIDHLTYAEYEEYRAGLLMTNEEYRTSAASTEELEEILNRMYEIGTAYYTERQAAKGTDNGENIPQSTPAPTADPYEGVYFSEEGTFYLIDEVMGTLETGTRTIHYADGTEYVEGIEFMSYMTDTQLVMETISTASTGVTRETNTVTIAEDGTVTVDSVVEHAESDTYDGLSFTASLLTKSTEVISDTRMISDEEETMTITYTMDGVTETQSESTKTHSDIEVLSETQANASLTVYSSVSAGGETVEMSADTKFTLERGTMPEGTLLRISGKPYNPLEATEAENAAFEDELIQLLTELIFNLIPAIETPSSVGGALMG